LSKLNNRYGALIVFAATITAMGLNFMGSVINTHMMSKEAFGDWKYIQSYLYLISYIINFGIYQSAQRLIANTDNRFRIAVFKGYMICASIAGLLVMFAITLVIGFISNILSEAIFHILLSCFPLFIIHPLMFYFEAAYQAEKKMIKLAVYKVLPPAFYVLSLYLVSTIAAGSVYINTILHYGTYLLVFVLLIAKDNIKFKWATREWSELKEENKSFGLHIYYGSLMGVGTGYLLPILVGVFNVDNSNVGNYTLALTFITPLTLLPSITGTSNYRRFAQIDHIPKKVVANTALASAAMIVATIFSIDFVIDIFFGPKFQQVAVLIKIGALTAALHGFGDFINKFLNAKGIGVQVKRVAILVGVVQLASSLVFIHFLSDLGAIIARALGSLTYFTCLLVIYKRKFGRNNRVVPILDSGKTTYIKTTSE